MLIPFLAIIYPGNRRPITIIRKAYGHFIYYYTSPVNGFDKSNPYNCNLFTVYYSLFTSHL
jgi:hypothetical protein